MLIADLLRAQGAPVVVDSRALARDTGAPSSLTVEHVTGTVPEIIVAAASTEPPAFAVITDAGRVFIVSTGGSGVIKIAGKTTNATQAASVAQIAKAAPEVWPGVELALDGNLGTSQTTPKPRKKAAAKKVVETPVVDIDDDDVPEEPDWWSR